MKKYQEIEFKYYADNVSLLEFLTYCEEVPHQKFFHASGFDHFYFNPKDPDSFYRHRIGEDLNQFSYKKKTVDKNNYIRTEFNTNLDPKADKEESRKQRAAEFEMMGYKYNTSIFKNAFIYVYDDHTLVYYICYDKDMKELGRFIEIEMSEEHPWVSETEAWEALVAKERVFKKFGISPQSRVKRSLFELFRKET